VLAERGLRRGGELTRGLPAVGRILRQSAGDDVAESEGYAVGQWWRLDRQVAVHHHGHVVTVEGAVPGEALVEHDGEGVDIDPVVGSSPGEKLRRHVGRGADDELRVVGQLREPQVDQVDVAGPGDRMFDGFTSWCTTPAPCPASSANATRATTCTARSGSSGPVRSTAARSVLPSNNGVTTYGRSRTE
jgi:hypothetical protein